jgi:periplasmic divalent cation tolerance protein
MKSRHALVPDVIKTVKATHPYDVPEVIALPVTQGHEAYLEWVKSSTGEANKIN